MRPHSSLNNNSRRLLSFLIYIRCYSHNSIFWKSKTELGVAGVLNHKMPIVLVSADGVNKNLEDFKTLQNSIDVLFHSEDSKTLYESMAKYITFEKVVSLDRLNPRSIDETDEDVKIRFQASLNTIRNMNVRTGMIISHHSVFAAWDPDLYVDEWGVIAM